jgi:putative DNA primase/helicase
MQRTERSSDTSHSAADLALCRELAFWTQDPEQICRLFERSGLMREKWSEHPKYADWTITMALETTPEHYQGVSAESNGQPSSNGQHTQDTRDEVPPTPDEKIHLTDVGNGLRLVQQFGNDIRFVPKWKKWLLWHDSRWMIDEGSLIEWHAKQVISGLYHDAARKMQALAAKVASDEKTHEQETAEVKTILKWALTAESGSHIETMVRRARVNPRVQVSHEQLDADRMLFQVINGTIDLRTGQLRPSRRSDLITKQSPVVYDPVAICPTCQAYGSRRQPTAERARDSHCVSLISCWSAAAVRCNPVFQATAGGMATGCSWSMVQDAPCRIPRRYRLRSGSRRSSDRDAAFPWRISWGCSMPAVVSS